MKYPAVIAMLGVVLMASASPPLAQGEDRSPAAGPLVAVGLARLEITPTEPVRLSGYGGRTEPAGRVEQKLWAKALAIGDDDQQPVVLITADLVGVTEALTEEVARRVAKNTAVDRSRLVICATHTHTGPVVKGTLPYIFREAVPEAHQAAIDRYAHYLTDRLEQVALAALAAREPGRLAWGQGKATFARNRRKIAEGRWIGFGAVADGAVDHSLPLLRVTNQQGEIVGLLVNYACHCTTLGGEHNFVHGDWAGTTQEMLEARYPDAIAMVTIGCGADANPYPRGTPTQVSDHAREIVTEVERLLATALCPLSGPPRSRLEQIALPHAEATTRSQWRALAESKRDRPARFARDMLARLDAGETLPTSLPYSVQTWTFGDQLAMVFLAGEVVVDYSLRLKRELDPDRLWVTAYANDLPCYIASRRVILEGGYEVDLEGSMAGYGRPGPLALEAEGLIIAAVTRQIPREFLAAHPAPSQPAAAPQGEQSSSARPSERRPNIVMIVSDDHGEQAISAYGSTINRTPALDRLAREGMLFRQSFVTNSICCPSRAVILTGKHSHINGQVSNYVVFDGSQPTFPQILQKAGYNTALIGKWHLTSTPTGFDHYQILRHQGTYYNPIMETAQGPISLEGYTTDIITDESLAWLKERDDDRPFLLLCQHKAPHADWKPRLDQLHLYEDTHIPEPSTLFDDYQNRSSAPGRQVMEIDHDLLPIHLHLEPNPAKRDELTPAQRAAWDAGWKERNAEFKAANLQGEKLVRWKYQRYVKNYLRTIAALDESIGRLLAGLDEMGLADNTIVIYASDQGYYLGEHGWCDKRWMYEQSLRTPLIVRWPGVTKPGSVDHHLVQNLDYAPTLLEAAGVEPPADMQGRSLVPLLKGQPAPDWRTSIYYHYYENPGWGNVPRHYGVRTERAKLIHFYELDEWEFFDLERDPHEMHSRYDDPQYAEIVSELKAELAKLQRQYRVTDEADRIHDRVAATSREAQAALQRAQEKQAARRAAREVQIDSKNRASK